MFATKFRRLAVGAGALAALSIAAVPIAAHASTASSGSSTTAATGGIVSYPVTFTVKNVDDATAIKTNPGDGKTYQVQGHITAPAGALGAANRAVTLYDHGLGYGEWFWNFTAVAGHDYAQEAAQQGLTSVTIDNLGYGASGKPDGKDAGYGTTATIDHQIIQDLKAGSYQVQGTSPVTFQKVALGASTQAVFSAELEDYTFHDANALVFTNFADEGFSPHLLTGYAANVLACTVAPIHQNGPGTPNNYGLRETTPAAFKQYDLNDTSPAVQAAAVPLHSTDPCGYPTYSVVSNLIQNQLGGLTITNTPVLSVFGNDDSEFIVPLATAYQKLEFAGNPDATIDTIAGAGQDITIGNKGTQFAQTVGAWLTKHGYATTAD